MTDGGHEVMLSSDYDGSAEGFARSAHPIYARLAAPLVLAAAVEPGERVLDVASGSGAVGGQLPGLVVGLDISAEQLRWNPLAEKRVGSAEAMPFADGSFDVVVCGFGINHFARPVVALGEFRRVLVSNGRIAVSTWLRPQPGYRPKEIVLEALRRYAGHSRTRAGQAVDLLSDRVGSVESLSALASEAGFSDVSVTVQQVEVAWPGADAFVDYRLAMLGAGEMLPAAVAGEFRRDVVAQLARLSPGDLRWQAGVVVATASNGGGRHPGPAAHPPVPPPAARE